MAPKYQMGQKVKIKPVKGQSLSLRDSSIEPYAGQSGEVTDHYSISPNRREVFYIYTVRIGTGGKKIVLHEDEMEAYVE